VASLETVLHRRLDREPVHRIIGSRSFYGREFELSADTLEPRSDTECLVDLALELLATRRSESLLVLDLGTGTGILAITLVAEFAHANAVAVDLAAGALATARKNAQLNGVSARIDFLESNWFAQVEGRFDLIVSNPPYIESATIEGLEPEVQRHDPALALDGGPDGLAAYRVLAAESGRHLSNKGLVLVEVGAGQLGDVQAIFEAQGFVVRQVATDLGGIERVIAFEKSDLFCSE
jgi:release factor glutamine methyltransferase